MQQRHSSASFYVVTTLGVVLISGAVYWYSWDKQRAVAAEVAQRSADVERGPIVATASAQRGPEFRKLELVGEARPYRTATLYAKVSGYLVRIAVDAGDVVQPGQFIAQVESPELDTQFRSASTLLENRRRIAERTRGLVSQKLLPQQVLDDVDTELQTQQDAVSAVRTLQDYRVLRAPFAGVVTTRYVDPGALITNATNSRTSAQPVVTISDASKLRVTVHVEQADAAYVRPGTKVEIAATGQPQVNTMAQISRVSGELDPRTRTMATQVDFDNAAGAFIAGSFAKVSVLIPAQRYIEVPVAALLLRDGKSLVAVLDERQRVWLREVTVAGTDGKVIRVASGLDDGERVALSLPSAITEGSRVRVNPS